ncbi:hypothetical protein QVD17_26256 [Tagetes erecta]|uniref:Uncharacterized protein n=1 Tax=Tagetes erecta TaxID=13708 RepID=A0AAD8K753_TARER|nr:hypothetical protein QVD17_26256 [Tagetes erecta]
MKLLKHEKLLWKVVVVVGEYGGGSSWSRGGRWCGSEADLSNFPLISSLNTPKTFAIPIFAFVGLNLF